MAVETQDEVLAGVRALVAAGVSVRSVATRAGVGLATLSRALAGKSVPGPDVRARLAAALDCARESVAEPADKRCPGCGQVFPREHFTLVRAKGYRGGKRRRSLCPACHNAQSTRRAQARAEAEREPQERMEAA